MDESKLEDFIYATSDVILVSTIHKSKGKEFDNVFLLLNDRPMETAEVKRLVYVGMTRAKNKLVIGYSGSYFKDLSVSGISYKMDRRAYSDPTQISLSLNLRDVYLGSFEPYKHQISRLSSGDSLKITTEGLQAENGLRVLRFSGNFRDKLSRYAARGFHLSTASVNYLVYWKNAEMENPVLTLLPEIVLSRQG